MSEKDTTEKTLEDYNDVFADIMNVLLFHGKQVIKEGELEATSISSQYKADDNRIHEMERDVAKIWKKCKVTIAKFGIEDQTDIDSDMVFRVIGYEGASYRSQLLADKNPKNTDSADDDSGDEMKTSVIKKERYPVITLVLYFGIEGHWKKRTLYEYLDIPEELKEYVNDYKINVFEIAYLDDETINSFQSDFRIVAKFFSQMRKNHRYVPDDEEIRHVDEVLKLMSVLTGDDRFKEAQKNMSNKGTERRKNTMIDAISEYVAQGEARGEARGIAIGEARGEVKAYSKMGNSVDEIAKKTGLSIDEVKEIQKSLSPVSQ